MARTTKKKGMAKRQLLALAIAAAILGGAVAIFIMRDRISAALDGGGIQVTGNFPGKARTVEELRTMSAHVWCGPFSAAPLASYQSGWSITTRKISSGSSRALRLL